MSKISTANVLHYQNRLEFQRTGSKTVPAHMCSRQVVPAVRTYSATPNRKHERISPQERLFADSSPLSRLKSPPQRLLAHRCAPITSTRATSSLASPRLTRTFGHQQTLWRVAKREQMPPISVRREVQRFPEGTIRKRGLPGVSGFNVATAVSHGTQ